MQLILRARAYYGVLLVWFGSIDWYLGALAPMGVAHV
jgi:hypothetical protein